MSLVYIRMKSFGEHFFLFWWVFFRIAESLCVWCAAFVAVLRWHHDRWWHKNKHNERNDDEEEVDWSSKRETLNRNLILLRDCFVSLIRVLFPWGTYKKKLLNRKVCQFSANWKSLHESNWWFFSLLRACARLTSTQCIRCDKVDGQISILDGKHIKIIVENENVCWIFESIQFDTVLESVVRASVSANFSDETQKKNKNKEKKQPFWRQFIE